jgi:serine protease Do
MSTLALRCALPLLLVLGAATACGPSADAPAPSPRTPGPSSAAAAASGADAAAAAAPSAAASTSPDFSALVRQVGPAVVNITAMIPSADVPGAGGDPLREFFRRFPPGQPPSGVPVPELPDEVQSGVGSGCIISADGYVLTSAHVVAGAQHVTVRLADARREFTARVVGTDPRSDVAVLKIDATGLPTARVGDSRSVQPGQWVAAIGSPFGFSNSITAGIVSATGRALPDESIVPFIQTDVAVNPGNSGGPLINTRGEVVGLNSQIYSRTGGYMGVSFAVPSDVVMEVFEQLRTTGRVQRGWLGVSIQPVTQELARSFKLDEARGTLVAAVEQGSPAARAGVLPGDIILAFAGQPLASEGDLPLRVGRTAPGTRVPLELWRRGERRQVDVAVGELPADPAEVQGPAPQPPVPAAKANNRLGLVLAELTPAQRRALGVPYGLVVQATRGPAAATALRRGDIITALNGVALTSTAQLNTLLAQQQAGAPVALLVQRGEASLYVPVPVPAG